ncbi:MAG TPA: MFS transporter [bacterium (Candidatus Stahlbacteria)]|nr:MFS transporter [Candidatus Stahlbacteria bacterium]
MPIVEQTYPKPPPRFKIWQKYDRRVWMLFISRLTMALGFSIALPFFSIYLHLELGVSMAVVGMIMMVAALTGAITMVIGGELSDRIGRKPLMCSSLFIRAIIFLLIAYFIKTKADFRIISALYILTRMLGSLFMPANDAMLADIVKPKRRVEAYGIMRIGANAGWALGPAIGGALAEISYAYLFILSSITSVIAGLLVLIFIKESLAVKKMGNFALKNILTIRRDVKLLAFCFVSLLIFIVMGQLIVTLSVFTVEHIGISKIQLGYLFTLNGLIVVFFQYPTTLLIRGINTMKILIYSSLIYALGYFLVGFASSFVFLVICIIIVTLGEIIFSPSSTALVANISPEESTGRYMGLFGLSRTLGWSLGPFIGGLLLDRFMQQGIILWGIIALIGIAAVVGYLVLSQTLFKRHGYG